jgi:hypothetical protein
MKKQITFLVLLALVGAFVLSLEGCGDEPRPCKNSEQVNARFKIAQKLDGIDSLLEVDTIFADGGSDYVFFEANEKDATYQWKIGTDSRTFNTKNFSLRNFPLGKIDVTLIVTKAPNKSCFPQDNGIDTVTKSFYGVSPKITKVPYDGIFTGVMSDKPTDFFDITIRDFGPSPIPDPCFTFWNAGKRIYNFPKGCASSVDPCKYATRLDQQLYRYFFINSSNTVGEGCNPFQAMFGRIYVNDRIVMSRLDYDVNKKQLVPTGIQFNGTRKK